MISIAVEKIKILILVLNVIEPVFTKLSKCFLYSFVDKNHLLNCSDPLAKKKDAANKNGVVGKIGNITPMTPRIKNRRAKVRHITFLLCISYNNLPPLSPLILVPINLFLFYYYIKIEKVCGKFGL